MVGGVERLNRIIETQNPGHRGRGSRQGSTPWKMVLVSLWVAPQKSEIRLSSVSTGANPDAALASLKLTISNAHLKSEFVAPRTRQRLRPYGGGVKEA